MLKVIKFSAMWCGPCQQLKPVFQEVKSRVADVSYQDVDVDAEPALASQYNVQAVPTIIIEKDGQEVQRLKGVMPVSAIVSAINSKK